MFSSLPPSLTSFLSLFWKELVKTQKLYYETMVGSNPLTEYLYDQQFYNTREILSILPVHKYSWHGKNTSDDTEYMTWIELAT